MAPTIDPQSHPAANGGNRPVTEQQYEQEIYAVWDAIWDIRQNQNHLAAVLSAHLGCDVKLPVPSPTVQRRVSASS